ncbi:ECF-type sigma factor, partial [[Clostridium] scindens]|uniref:ECF-type sigma factor n=1 Tax=Clostridium scindens (strain JCM 10418 / VPI 12708) TaxID=29347 RepID=UPI001D089924
DYAESENLHNCTGGKSAEDEVMESEAIKEILEILSDIQRKIVALRMDGYSNRETFLFLEIKPSTYYKEMQRIKTELENLRK